MKIKDAVDKALETRVGHTYLQAMFGGNTKPLVPEVYRRYASYVALEAISAVLDMNFNTVVCDYIEQGGYAPTPIVPEERAHARTTSERPPSSPESAGHTWVEIFPHRNRRRYRCLVCSMVVSNPDILAPCGHRWEPRKEDWRPVHFVCLLCGDRSKYPQMVRKECTP